MEVILGESRMISASTNYNLLKRIQWSPPEITDCANCLQTSIFTFKPGKLYLEILTYDDCYAIDSMQYYITKNVQYFYPNVIKLSSVQNNIFKIHPSGSVKNLGNLKIYDRWGNMVFESRSGMYEWSGHMNMLPCEEGVYIWTAELILFDDSKENINGHVTLLKE